MTEIRDDKHYPWCDTDECTKFGDRWHPSARAPVHLSRRYVCNPGDQPRATGVVLQFARFSDVPHPGRDFVRMEITEPDERQTYYIDLDIAVGMRDALTDIATLPRIPRR